MSTLRTTPSTAAGTAAPAVRAPKSAAPRRRGPLHRIGVVLSALVLLAVLSVGILVVAVPAIARATPYTILTGSMQPGYPPGTLVVVRKVDPADIRIGDIVTYQLKSGERAVVTHRVISIETNAGIPGRAPRFVTKGDANDLPDPAPVRGVQIRGEVWYAVPYVGWLNNVVNGSTRPAIIPVVAGVLFLYAAWTIGAGIRDRMRARRAGETEQIPSLTAFPRAE